MSKLKRVFTIIMCVLLTMPTCLVSKPNNVYAASTQQTRTTGYWYDISELAPDSHIDFSCYQNIWYGHQMNSGVIVGSFLGNYDFSKQLEFRVQKADGTYEVLAESRIDFKTKDHGGYDLNTYGGSWTHNGYCGPQNLYGGTKTVYTNDIKDKGYTKYGIFLNVLRSGSNCTAITNAQNYSIPLYYNDDFSEYGEYLLDSGSKNSTASTPFSSPKVDVTDYDYVKVEVSTPATTVCIEPRTIYANWELSLINNGNVKQKYYLVNGEYSAGTDIKASEGNTKNIYIFDTRNIKGELYLDGTFTGSECTDTPEGATETHHHSAYGYYSIIGFGPKTPLFKGDLGSGNLTPVNLSLAEPKATYDISASNTTSLGMKIDGGTEQKVEASSGKFEVKLENFKYPSEANACNDGDSDGKCDKCHYDMGKGSCHTIQFFAHGASGDAETSVGTFYVDYTPVYTGVEEERKASTVEGAIVPLHEYAKFPKKDSETPGWYQWQYRLDGEPITTWHPINDKTSVLKDNITIGDTNYSMKDDGVFGISSISGSAATSRLSVKAVSTDMDNIHFRCLLISGIDGVANAAEASAKEYTLRVLPSQYKYFSNIQRSESIGTEVYDNSMLYLTYANETGGDGRTAFVQGDLRQSFVNTANGAPYFNIIKLDAECLKTNNKYKKLWGIGNGVITVQGANLAVNYEDAKGTPEVVVLDEVLASDVADPSSITREERDMMIRKVLGDIDTLRAATEQADDSNPVTIKAGKNIVISYLSPFRTCDGHTFIDANSDTKCDTCGGANYEDIENYVFATTTVNGIDTEAPNVKDITAKWIANANGANFYEDGAIFKQGLNGTNNTPLSGSIARPFQALKLIADISDNSVALENLTIKWYHKAPGSDTWVEVNPNLVSNNGTELRIPGSDVNNGSYKVTANDGNVLDNGEREFEVGVVWDSIAPTVNVTISPNSTEYTAYKEIEVEASDAGTGLDDKPYIISSRALSASELAENWRWGSRNTLTVDTEGTYYVYVRDFAGCIKDYNKDNGDIVIGKIDHTAPCVEGITTEKVGEGDEATVMVTIHATDDCQTDPDQLFYKVAWICERASSAYSTNGTIGEEILINGDEFTNNKTFEAKESGYYKLYVADDAGNITPVRSSYIDYKFITGKLDDIFNGGSGGGFTDEKGGFTDEGGGFTDETGGFTDGFEDNKGGFTDTEGGYVDNNGFTDNNGFKDNGFKDKNGFEDNNGYVDLDGFVDKTHYHDYKGDATTGDTFCDECGKDSTNCSCEGGFVDNESPNGECDGCHVTYENRANCTCGTDGLCDKCGLNEENCTCTTPDNLCDKCGNDSSSCTHTTPDGKCDHCYQDRELCTCAPDGKCDGCGQAEKDCTCVKDNLCDVCGGDKVNCICPKDQLCDNCGFDREHCTCAADGKCDKCGEVEANCNCGDGKCDRCGETEENCHCPDGLCDHCHKTSDECECRDGACDGCGKDREHCECPDGLCDKCGQDREHCHCPDGICDTCGRDEEHCICPDGICDNCGQDREHCHCPDGICDKCGQDKDNCHCVGVSVGWSKTPLSATNGGVTFSITATMNALADEPFSWDDGAHWSADTEYTVYENGTYTITVKDKNGNLYSKSEEVTNIDTEPPYLTGGLNSDTNTIELKASDNLDGSGLYKITYFFTPEGETVQSEERAFRPFSAEQYSADINFYVEEAGTYVFRLYDNTEATNPGEGNYYDLEVDTDPTKLSTTNPDVSTNPEVMKGYITASTTDWTTGNVVLTLNMSDVGLASRPYCWNGKDWVTTPFVTVEENCTVTLKVKDKQGHEFVAAPYEVTNIDKVAPTFTLNYSATNGNFVEVNAVDEGSGIASIYWQGGTVTSLTKALDVLGAPKSGSFSIQVPANGQYRVWVIDVAGNGYMMETSETFKATSVTTTPTDNNTNSGNNNTSSSNGGLSDAQYKGLLNAINALGNKQTSGGGTTNNYYTSSSGSSGGTTSKAPTTGTTSSVGTTSTPSNVGKIQTTTSSSSSATDSVDNPTKAKTTTSSSSKVTTTTAASKPKAVTSSTTATVTKPKVTTLDTKEKEDASVDNADIAAMNRNSRIQGVEATADTGSKKGVNIILAIFAGLVAIGGITAGIWYYNKKHNEYTFDELSDDMEFDDSRLSEEGDSEE